MINKEIIEAFTIIAKEKNIDRSELTEVIEKVFYNIINKKYGTTENFDVIVNMEKGEIEIYQEKLIVDKVTDPVTEIDLESAKKFDPDLELGDVFIDVVDPSSFGRRLIANARQDLNQKILEIEKNLIFEDYSKRIGEIIVGDIHHIRRDALFVNINKAELKMPVKEQIPTERYRRGSQIRAIIKETIKEEKKPPEIIISRADPMFLIRLFEAEVPEIYDGIIEIKKVARIPGKRSKIVVESNDKRIDAVGACVGIKGSRIQAIVRELNNEKIDIINYSSEPEILVTRALSPAKPIYFEFDDENKRVVAVFDDDEISVAIGKHGENIQLASEVTGYTIDAVKKSDYDIEEVSDLYIDEIEELSPHLIKLIGDAGYLKATEFLEADREDLLQIKGMGEKTLDKALAIVEKVYDEFKNRQEKAAKEEEELEAELEENDFEEENIKIFEEEESDVNLQESEDK